MQGARSHARDNVDRYLLGGYLAATLAFLPTTSLAAHRAWAVWAAVGYTVSLLATLIPPARRWAAWIALVGAVGLPLITLASAGLAQPEVHVLVDGARSLLARGTPYVGPLISVDDARPYLPALFLFGLPGALGLPQLAGDPRLWIDATFVGSILVFSRAVTSGSSPLPFRPVALFLAMPLMALALSTSAIDLPLTAASLLAVGLAHQVRTLRAGLATGAASAMKPTAALLALLVASTQVRTVGVRRTSAYLVTGALVAGVAILPVALRDWPAMWENVVAFPAGLTGLTSPAQSPFPGVILSDVFGPAVSLALLTLGVIVNVVFAMIRPPKDLAGTLNRVAVAFLTAYALAPSSRAGYLVLPATLWFGAWLSNRSAQPLPSEG